jgi:hypothetical protein
MATKPYSQIEVAEDFGRTIVKGNIPEIHPIRCLGCTHWVVLCKKLGPNASIKHLLQIPD